MVQYALETKQLNQEVDLKTTGKNHLTEYTQEDKWYELHGVFVIMLHHTQIHAISVFSESVLWQNTPDLWTHTIKHFHCLECNNTLSTFIFLT